ncbi:transglutaminaseTgpA domain-containing protein [Candidatus Magnetominusculus dajiuhuensis]|uniref:transglutaminase family protein n=1 Tax=Candidatus Magnetominusculus dajiuhuensis TaxID=3137712 RepID=UPI003B43A6C0
MYLPGFIKTTHSIRVETAVKLVSYAIALTGFISVCAYVEYVYSALFVLVVVIAGYLDFKKSAAETSQGYVPRWVINVLSVIVIILSVFRMYTDDLVESAVEALLILLSIKFLEKRSFRDYMQVYLISLFLLAGAALLSIDLSFFLYFMIFFFLISPVIVLLTYYSQAPQLIIQREVFVKIVLKTMAIPLLSIPMASIIFLVLPRTDRPFFSFLNRAGRGRSGFADSVTLGGVSSIQQDSSVVFRASMEKLDDELLYWRGVLFDTFDGTSWKSSLPEDQTHPSRARGRHVRQTIYLEPYGNKYVFALDKPISVSIKNIRSPGGFIYLTKEPITSRLRYDAVSVIEEQQPVTVQQDSPGQYDIERYLKLPPDIPEGITALAQTLTKGKDRRAAIEAILTYLKDGGYSYSLEHLPASQSPLSEFLFKTKSGNCEYFASAMAVMLRASGIPANVVGGYKGGQYNNLGGYYMVMQKNAHVWVEAYIDGERWRRYDPTPAAAFSLSIESKGAFLRTLQSSFDALNYYWGVFVINYNFDRQLSMLKKLRTNINVPVVKSSLLKIRTGLKHLKTTATLIAAALALILLIIILRLIYFNNTPQEKRLLEGFLKRLSNLGFDKKQSDGLEEFIATITDDGLRRRAGMFAVEFEKIYYRDERFTKEQIKRLRAILKTLVSMAM